MYVEKGTETIVKKMARDIYVEMCVEHGRESHVPKIHYVNEVLELIRVETAKHRDEIDNDPRHKYIVNLKN